MPTLSFAGANDKGGATQPLGHPILWLGEKSGKGELPV